MKKTTGLLLLLTLFCLGLKAQTYYSLTSGSGTWGGTWSTVACGGANCGCTPGTSIEICSGTTMTYSGSLAIGSTGTLIVDAGATLIVTADCTFSNGSTVNVKSGATVVVDGNFTNKNNSNGVTVNGSFTVGGNASFGNGSSISGTTGTFTVDGSSTFTGAGTGTVLGQGAPGCTGCTYWSGGSSPLPIALLEFNGSYNNIDGKVSLFWSTASETNNKYFTIERSTGGDFVEITQIAGNGNSSQTINYNTIDPNPVEGVDYYRLKQTDFDGNTKYYQVVPVNVTTVTGLMLFPNPASTTLMVSYYYPSACTVQFQVLDVTGQLISSGTIQMQKGNNTYSIDVSTLAHGMYFIQADINGQIVTKKFVK